MRLMVVLLLVVQSPFVHSVAATAQDTNASDYARPGFYLGIGVEGASYTKLADDLENALAALGYVATIDTDIGAGFNLYGGYRTHPNFALEAEFEMIPSTDLDAFGIKFADLEAWAFTGNLKMLALTGKIQPFGVVGVGVFHGKLEDSRGVGIGASGSGFAARFGGGVDLYSTEKIALSARATYVLPTGDVEGLDYVSFGAGVQYRF